ncbi:hypothetical protein BD769DRAFT_1397543 [Suillus cothurnatus]|nr:hypothetical protein BD769DRAFT_1397543 [Suillus cothurnatus]
MEWTVLAQAPASAPMLYEGQDLGLEDGDETKKALRNVIMESLQCFSMEAEHSVNTYAWETMSESLKIASACSVALRELDENLHTHLTQLLSDNLGQPCSEIFAQALLRNVQRFLSSSFDIHLRHFAPSPLSIFEFAFNTEKHTPPPPTTAAKCFALRIKKPSQLPPGDDYIMSNMYSHLNYIVATSKEIMESSSSNQLLSNLLYASSITSPNDNVTF